MKVNEVAARLEVAPGTIYDLCASGQLPHNRVGVGRGTIRISEIQLQEYLNANERSKRPMPIVPPVPIVTPEPPARRRKYKYFN